jgi:hypothetical protein
MSTTGEPASRPLGEWLVRRGLLSRSQLFEVLDVAYRHGCRLGDAVVWLGLVGRAELELEARSLQLLRKGQGSE